MPRNGYAWWYLDALSDDGQHALTVIALVGSVFSPYYAWSRRRDARGAAAGVDARAHCALNVALYARGNAGRRRWSMTERGLHDLETSPQSLAIGPSELAWDGDCLVWEIDEVTAPLPSHLRGTVRLHFDSLATTAFALDIEGRHWWRPIAPRARVEVDLRQPGLRWSGQAYLDCNWGDRPLEDDFKRWDWCRADWPGSADPCAPAAGGSTIFYDVERRRGEPLALAVHVGLDGELAPVTAPPMATLSRTPWGIARNMRCEGSLAGASTASAQAQVLQTLEDGPFYARSLVSSHWCGAEVEAVHESLSLDRFRSPWVQMLLPVRMPRRAARAE